jgi:hypothetical protein
MIFPVVIDEASSVDPLAFPDELVFADSSIVDEDCSDVDGSDCELAVWASSNALALSSPGLILEADTEILAGSRELDSSVLRLTAVVDWDWVGVSVDDAVSVGSFANPVVCVMLALSETSSLPPLVEPYAVPPYVEPPCVINKGCYYTLMYYCNLSVSILICLFAYTTNFTLQLGCRILLHLTYHYCY